MDELTARSRAQAYGAEHLTELGERRWRGTRFDGGWLMTPMGDDIAWNTGVACLIVLDDGTIHQESSSLPPPLLIEKYRSAGSSAPNDRQQ